MRIRLTIDKAGRVLIPKPLRDELGLSPGDTLELERRGEKITLRPVRGPAPLAKVKRVWVFRNGTLLSAATTDAVLNQLRAERDNANVKGPVSIRPKG